MPMSCSLKVQAESSCTERNPIGHRTRYDDLSAEIAEHKCRYFHLFFVTLWSN